MQRSASRRTASARSTCLTSRKITRCRSTLSPSSKVDIVRGPGALRFGSQAVGGVVDVNNNRIPTAAPLGGLAAELKSGVTSVNRGWESGLLLDAGGRNAAVHADIYGRSSGDYSVPSYPYLVPPVPAPAFNGKQPNSASQSAGAAIGGSWLFDGGYAGIAVSRFTSDYYVPGIATAAARQHNDLEQTKISSKGEYRPDASALAAVRYWTGYSEYRHDETVLGTAGFQEITATFKNKQTEGKLEFEFAPFATPFGPLTSIVGAQGAYQQLDTAGQAILLPAQTRTAAAYFLNEVRHTDTLRTQLAGRIEGVNVAGTAFTFPPNFLPPPNEPSSAAAKLDFMPKSISFGIIKDLPSSLVASLTLQRIERAPRALELFAQGPDGSEKTFKIGNANLGIETALDGGNRPEAHRWRFQVRRECLLHGVRQVHFLARHRHSLPGDVCFMRGRHRLHPGQLRSARRDLPRRRTGLAMGCRTARQRHLRHRWSV